MNRLNNIVKNLQFPKEFLAVEYHFGREADYLAAAHLKLNKDELQLLGTSSGPAGEAPLESLDRNLPVVVLFSGKRVLSKKAQPAAEEMEEEVYIRQAFPSVNQEELLFQVQQAGDAGIVISAMRKEHVSEILQTAFKGRYVLDICLDLYPLWDLLQTAGLQQTMIGFHEIDLASGTVRPGNGAVEETIDLLGETLENRCGIAFLRGLKFAGKGVFESHFPEVLDQRHEWKFRKWYKKGITIGAAGLFALLLVNFLLFSHYSESNERLVQQTSAYNTHLKQLETLKSTYEAKREFLINNGSQESHSGKIADQVAALVPKGIELSQMAFQPVTRRLKKENLVRFSRNQLNITGKTRSYTYFQQWISGLKKLDWVESLQIAGYEEKDPRHAAEFSIIITIKG